MALEAFIPEIWAGEVLLSLTKAQVFAAVCNRDYEGEIKKAGDMVRIGQIGRMTISAYVPNSTTLTRQNLDDAEKQLHIDQKYYFDFEIDDVEAAQARPNIMQAAMREAAYGLNNTADAAIGGKYTEAGITAGLGTEATPIDVTSINVVEYIGFVGQKMSESNTPEDGRWMVIPPWFQLKIALAGIALKTENASVFSEGFIGRAMGFDFYVSNNVSTGTPATNQKTRIMAGYRGTITFAEQLITVEAYRPQGAFSDAVKGLYVYGIKTVRADTLACLRADYVVEP